MSADLSPDAPGSPGGRAHAVLFAAVFEHSLDALLLVDNAMRYVDANPSACRLLGYTRDELCRLTIPELTTEEYRPRVPEAWAAYLGQGCARKEWQFRAKDGSVRIVDLSCTANVLPGLHLSAARDVTAQKKAEAEADLLRRALDALDHGVMITDHTAPDEPIVYTNPAVTRFTGYESGDLLGRNPHLLRGPYPDQPGLAELRAALAAGTECMVELIDQRKNGDVWVNLLSLTPIRDADGRITHHVGVQTDVTRLRGYLMDLHPARGSRPATPPPARRTVLLVEDEDTVREFVRMVLEQAGYEVVCAADGEQALNVYRAGPDQIDLVLTDVVMPNRTGPDLAAELRQLWPDVRVLFMSGYTGGTASTPVEMPPGALLLDKPFSLDHLLRAVASALQ
jgi:PAS domain S-box-containing protein